MTLTTPNEREDWKSGALVYLRSFVSVVGRSSYSGSVSDYEKEYLTFISELLSRTRQEEREKMVEYIKANSALTDNPIESNGQLIDCSYYQIYAGALEQARNLT